MHARSSGKSRFDRNFDDATAHHDHAGVRMRVSCAQLAEGNIAMNGTTFESPVRTAGGRSTSGRSAVIGSSHNVDDPVGAVFNY